MTKVSLDVPIVGAGMDGDYYTCDGCVLVDNVNIGALVLFDGFSYIGDKECDGYYLARVLGPRKLETASLLEREQYLIDNGFCEDELSRLYPNVVGNGHPDVCLCPQCAPFEYVDEDDVERMQAPREDREETDEPEVYLSLDVDPFLS